MSLRLFAFFLALSVSIQALGANPTLTGTEVEFWDTGSVVYGVISSIADTSADTSKSVNRATVTLDVLTVLAGTLDPMRNYEIKIPVRYGGRIDAIRELPPVKSHVLVVLEIQPNGEYRIWGNPIAFMPHFSPIEAVKGFDETEVQEMIVRLRALRKFKGNWQEAVKQGVDLYPKRRPSE
jgi:hypothetical protein